MKTYVSLLLALLLLSVTPSLAHAKKGGGTQAPGTLHVTYCWSMSYVDPGCPTQQVQLQAGGVATTEIDDNGQLVTVNGTWSTANQGKDMVLVLSFAGYPTASDVATYTGTRPKNDANACYLGTMSGYNTEVGNLSGAWEGCF